MTTFQKWFLIILVIFGIGIGYYFFIFVPESKEQLRQEKQKRLQACMDDCVEKQRDTLHTLCGNNPTLECINAVVDPKLESLKDCQNICIRTIPQ